MTDTAGDIAALRACLKDLNSAVLSFSGGVDSALLLHLLKEAELEKFAAVTFVSELFDKKGIEKAGKTAQKLGVEHVKLDFPALNSASFTSNDKNRCYYCKSLMFGILRKFADENGIENIIDGTNASDISDYRPGMKAAREYGVISPFKSVGLCKDKIREISRKMRVDGWDRTGTVCFASRIPYNSEVTAEKIKKIKEAEEFLKELGFDICRVRSDGESARIEVEPQMVEKVTEKENRDQILDRFMELGFSFISVDIEGFKSGKTNRMIGKSGERRKD